MKCLQSIILATVLTICAGQSMAQNKLDAVYEANQKKEYINGMYIPATMKEAFRELINLSNEKSLDNFKAGEEEVIARKLHFGLGKWIAVKWNFYEGSRFTKYLGEMGVSHPDDMVQFTIVSFHRFLNKRPLEFKERAAVYKEKRDKEFEEKLAKAKTISSKKIEKK